jgi:small neutral amino acid transporter SnatA (MarC family)
MGCGALTVAVLCVGIMLFYGSSIERIVAAEELNILSKLTGLILSALRRARSSLRQIRMCY